MQNVRRLPGCRVKVTSWPDESRKTAIVGDSIVSRPRLPPGLHPTGGEPFSGLLAFQLEPSRLMRVMPQ